MLEIRDLHAATGGNEILRGLNLTVNEGEVHAIMGPNGSGKSTLSKVIAGHPDYTINSGDLLYEIGFDEIDLTTLEPDVRAKEGVFLAFQYPIEVPGVTNMAYLQTAYNSICKYQGAPELNEKDFNEFVREKAKLVEMDPKFLDRAVNEGFSGGEKKRNEILQMAVLNPRLALLDETDSGLDIDALKVVSKGVNAMKSADNAIVMVTHYQRLLDYIVPDFVHVLYKGRIVESGDKSLAKKLEAHGYDWIIQREEKQVH